MPGKDLPSVSIWEADKLVHFIVYVLLAVLMYYGWHKQPQILWLKKNTVLKILVITSAYGFAVEVMQEIFTADRHFDLFDALANAIGAIAGSLACVKLFKQAHY